MTTYLKVIGPDNRACHGGSFDYTDYLPTEDGPGWWLPNQPARLCTSGWHWCTPESLMNYWAKANMRVYEVEPSDDVTARGRGGRDGKCVSSSGRLLREHPLPQWWTDAMAFAAELQNIPKIIPWFQPDGSPHPEWRVFTAPMIAAAWDAVRDAVQDAVRGAAIDAARDATRDAAWSSTRGSARDAARDAVRDAVQDAVRGAVRGASWDAALYALVTYVCADLPIDQCHRDHAAARWEVWRKGYACLCDVNGVLYVYAAERGE